MLDAISLHSCATTLLQSNCRRSCDERGAPWYQHRTGERRANAAKCTRQGKGVNGEQISIVSYGKEKPAVLVVTPEADYAKTVVL